MSRKKNEQEKSEAGQAAEAVAVAAAEPVADAHETGADVAAEAAPETPADEPDRADAAAHPAAEAGDDPDAGETAGKEPDDAGNEPDAGDDQPPAPDDDGPAAAEEAVGAADPLDRNARAASIAFAACYDHDFRAVGIDALVSSARPNAAFREMAAFLRKFPGSAAETVSIHLARRGITPAIPASVERRFLAAIRVFALVLAEFDAIDAAEAEEAQAAGQAPAPRPTVSSVEDLTLKPADRGLLSEMGRLAARS